MGALAVKCIVFRSLFRRRNWRGDDSRNWLPHDRPDTIECVGLKACINGAQVNGQLTCQRVRLLTQPACYVEQMLRLRVVEIADIVVIVQQDPIDDCFAEMAQ